MNKSEYTLEDFVLDPEFKKWVLNNDPEAKAYWVEFMGLNKDKIDDIQHARKILINLSRKKYAMNQDELDLQWKKIDERIGQINHPSHSGKVVSLDSWSAIQRHKDESNKKRKKHFWRGIAASFLLVLASTAFFWFQIKNQDFSEVEPKEVFVLHEAPAGVKTTIALPDGSKVFLNSGSSLRYVKNLEGDVRLLTLRGEAFFDVAKDTLRPFVVKTNQLSTTALGTSFNIKAYSDHVISISLLTGSVFVNNDSNSDFQVRLAPGEGVFANTETNDWRKEQFDPEEIIAWMNKTLIFNDTPMSEAILKLENWFGVKIEIQNPIPKSLTVSGKFKDENLKNILEGLSYGSRFSYSIEGKEIKIQF
ncbi:hypothetical protein P872_23445 [Rhodonellum psychrophilum GCM71 = DSM 17998]|uniref:FecR protein domain-containing protein n=2 Tax=Rhodonellum TaxID=336827 RepID=U5C8X4_9BACT|nr:MULTISPECIES: FecR domain-containing protein [Rhodonellum]ERM84667.1 hypothetical protein P872_23445 [Rhodonellum psychrophilum GCM71 = DSM 17998]SDZ13554.1 FecR family protein [Rhodonellum ikkaensis]